VEQRIFRSLTDEQLRAIISYKPKSFPQKRVHKLSLLLIDTGLRISEALGLERSHIRASQGYGLAGLWERWRAADGESLETCKILTTEANHLLRPVHERMPVILPPESYTVWLNEDVRPQESRKELLHPFPASEMICQQAQISS
jgi:hypothetical protein